MGRPDMIPAQIIDINKVGGRYRPRPLARKEKDGLLVPPDKASTLLTDHLITRVLVNRSV